MGDMTADLNARATFPFARPQRHRSALLLGATAVLPFLLCVVGIHHHVELYHVEHESMEPTLHDGDRIVVEKKARFRGYGPDRGDVVVLRGVGGDESQRLVKRVVGLPGETIAGRFGAIHVDGTRLEESYLRSAISAQDFPPTTLGEDQYFLLGDNRAASVDSRTFGAVKRGQLVGRVILTVGWLGQPWRLGIVCGGVLIVLLGLTRGRSATLRP